MKRTPPFCSFFNPILDFLQAVKITKSGPYLLHESPRKGYGSITGLTSQTSLHVCLQRRCKSVCDVKPLIDPCPLLATIHIKMSLICMRMKSRFHMKG